MKYTKKDLKKMSLKSLRALDINSPEEEAAVQEEIDARLENMPLEIPLNIPASFTDDLTPEKERALQAKIDKKIESMKAGRTTKKEKITE